MKNAVQGCSKITVQKEFDIFGVTYMRMLQSKNQYFFEQTPKIIIADVFCGTGVNEVSDEIINGSPVRILDAYVKASTPGKKTKPFKCNTHFWFSDIRKDACEALRRNISNYSANSTVYNGSAANVINELGNAISKTNDCHLFLVVDPNGPKDFPKYEIEHLIRSFGKRVDVILNISATAINRCIGARNKAGTQFKSWLSEIENFDNGLVETIAGRGRDGWIRDPIDGDRQKWTILSTFGRFIPKHGWEKQGHYHVKSERGYEIRRKLCGGTI